VPTLPLHRRGYDVTRLVIRPARTIGSQGLSSLAGGLIVATLIVLFLYMGREILEPLVIAALLGFILSPLIRRLRGWGLWRVPSVILAVVFAIAVIAALGSTIVYQVAQLAEELPKYETNLRTKLRALGGGSLMSSSLERASDTLKDLQNEISKPAPPTPGQKPLLVEVRQPEPKGLESIANVVRPLLSPLATTALAVLFLLFILLQREDIRDRFLRLAGTADLQRSTAALDDAAARLSRFFLMQTILNAGFGLFIGVGLWLIGVPNAVLWGILAGLMRFVPFVGSIIAAFFPIALAAAVDPGWGMVLATAALFIVAEPVAGHVIEPVLYGQHTGLSAVAVVVSTLFWALLWGPIGLLLATPLTVCLVVLGRHIEALEFIEVLLGDEPALEAEERFYQRLLAGDATEAADQAEEQLKEQSLSAYYDSVPMKALGLAQADAAHGKLPADKQLAIRDTMEEIVEDLADHADEPPEPKEGQPAHPRIPSLTSAQRRPEWQVEYPVLCIASRSPLDEAAATMLAQLLEKHGLPAKIQPFADVASARSLRIDARDAPLVCLSYFGAVRNPAHVRFLIRRLKRMMPNTKFLACFWMLAKDPEKGEEWRTAVGAHLVATSLTDAVSICLREAVTPNPRQAAAVSLVGRGMPKHAPEHEKL
jgi:predicted PurR-regulated permease PerM